MERIRGKDRWQLTDETLACLLDALGDGAEQPLERYTRLQERLIFFFMRHRARLPEDLADQTLDRLARALLEGRPVASLEGFALGIARMIVREEQARAIREQRVFAELGCNRLATEATPEERENEMEMQQAEFEALTPETRGMLAAYHDGQGARKIDGRRQLARGLGISMGALRKRVFDLQSVLRKNLRSALEEEEGNLLKRKEKRHR